ncbi:ABC transporter ATP-binding protein [Bordetella trematum]|uniref:ABC transporter ATP-binding protein n=1 Tax=Bordetella trematum TaxID=123899 RepID=UPI00047282D2|nr:ABC transporter ATP-binding protein [Bordetella trematum]
MSAALTLSGVSQHFGAREVLRGIDLQLAPGEIVALLGASGCGKSTLLNLVAGLRPLQQGRITLQPAGARLGYLFQEDRLLPWLSVLDNAALGLEPLGLGRAARRERARQALALVGLADFALAWPHMLSGGMRSRAALARSLVTDPALLLMDEPFSKLDPNTRNQMHAELLAIQARRGTTILMVTHDVEEAVVLADKVVLLAPRPGRIAHTRTLDLPRPRLPTDPSVTETTRQLRLQVSA